jgi:hypothetical protein
MTYSHYWHPTRPFSYRDFAEVRSAVNRIVAIASISPWQIGVDFCLQNTNELQFNRAKYGGEASCSKSAFYLEMSCLGIQSCQTGRKRYDPIVVASLIAAEVIATSLGFSMSLSSDGSVEDWQTGRDLYEQCFPGKLRESRICFSDGTLIRPDLPSEKVEEASARPLPPIYRFIDHPSRKTHLYDFSEILYLIGNSFFISSRGVQPEAIVLKKLSYTNMAEPYRELARLDYTFVGTGYNDSIDIDYEDAAELLFWHHHQKIALEATSELTDHRQFDSWWQSLQNTNPTPKQ